MLVCMPPDLSRLTALQTLTCFVVGTGSDCSNLGELQHLNLYGGLELRQLENVTEADAKAANLGDKQGLTELTLSWYEPLEEEGRYHTVLQGLKPHDGLRALKIYCYQGTTFPAWMGMLQKVVELCLSGCQKLQKLPPLCKLPELRLLTLCGLEKVKFLCSDDTSFTFPKLKELELDRLPDFERWCEIDWGQGEQIMFPQLENLSIESCNKLTALPEAPLLRGDHTSFNSAFPELKVIRLDFLNSLKSWGVTEGTDGEQPTFPNLENARIVRCPELTSFPEAPKISALQISDSGSQQTYIRAARYAMTSLSSLYLTHDGLEIELPADLADGETSPLSIMDLEGCNFFFRSSALALWKCFVQLQDLNIRYCDGLVHWPEKEFQSLVSLRTLYIYECSKLTGYAPPPDQSASERSQLLPRSFYCSNRSGPFFFRSDGSDSRLLSTFAGSDCRESHFTIHGCDRLRSLESCLGELPSLKSLSLYHCGCLAAIPNGPQAYTSLQSLVIENCPGIKSLARCLQRRLDGLERKNIDTRFEVPRLSKPRTWKYAINRDW